MNTMSSVSPRKLRLQAPCLRHTHATLSLPTALQELLVHESGPDLAPVQRQSRWVWSACQMGLRQQPGGQVATSSEEHIASVALSASE